MACEDINSRINRHLVLSRIIFFVALGLTIAGGVLEGSDSISDYNIGVKLVKAGYSLVVVFVACLLAIQMVLWSRYSWLSDSSRTVSLRVEFWSVITSGTLALTLTIWCSDSHVCYPHHAFHSGSGLLFIPFNFLSLRSALE